MVFTLNLLTSVNLKSKIKKFIYSFIGRKGSFPHSGGEELFFYNSEAAVFFASFIHPLHMKKILLFPLTNALFKCMIVLST